MHLTHQEIKDLIKEYRERAVRIYENDIVKINWQGRCDICEDGAFVEATIWVPKQ